MKKVFIFLIILCLLSFVQAKENYLILTNDIFYNSSSLNDLVSLREADYNVIVLNVQNKSNIEIKNLIFQKNSLVGVSYILIFGGNNLIPSGLDMNESYYMDLNNDGILDIPLGRLPFSKEVYMRNVVDKIIQFENSKDYQNKNVLLMAGTESIPASAFTTATYYENELIPLLGYMNISKAYYVCGFPECPNLSFDGDVFTRGEEIDKLTLKKMNNITYFNYIGHGGNLLFPFSYFPSIPLFNFMNLDGYLENKDNYFIANLQSCSSIQLHDVGVISYETGVGNRGYASNTLLAMEDKGAVAVIGSTEGNGGNQEFGKLFYINIQTEKTLGKAYIKSNPIYKTVLLGDPALKINYNLDNNITGENMSEDITELPEINENLTDEEIQDILDDLFNESSDNESLDQCSVDDLLEFCNTYFDEGYSKGLIEGHNAGVIEGYDNGYNVGYSKGHDEGYELGLTEGYNNGYLEGFNQGKTVQKINDEKEISLLKSLIKILIGRLLW